MTDRLKFLVHSASSILLLSCISTGAVAQNSGGSEIEGSLLIEEVLVTARKRTENLRDTPLTVTAISSKTIEKAGINDVQDLAMISPGLSYREGFGRATGNANNRPSIRGMSSVLGSPNAAFFVDGIYINGPISSYSMVNLERVEVIRGPQAATFGRGTFAGAINFVTRRPTDETMGRLSASLGDHSYKEFNGFVSGPLVEGVLSGEVNVRYYDQGGDPEYPNLSPTGGEIGAEETKALGMKLNWTINEKANLYLNVNYSKDSDSGFAYGLWNGGDNDANQVNVLSPNTSNCFGPEFKYSIFTANMSRGYWCGEIKTPKAFWNNTGGLDGASRETLATGLIGDFQFGNWTLATATGYTTYDYENAFGDINNYVYSAVSWQAADNNTTFSQELRLMSPSDERIRYMVGAYYYDEQVGNGFNTSFSPNRGETVADADVAGGSYTNDSSVNNIAVFGSVDFDITDDLMVSAEIRYAEEKVTLSGKDSDGLPLYDAPPAQKFTATLPRLAFNWATSDTLNLYGSWAIGNNPGGFNDAYYDRTYVKAERDLFVATRGTYAESEVTAYELGIKGLFLDGRMSINAAVFYNDWKKQALSDSDALTIADTGTQTTVTYITNAGRSTVQGIELELFARATNWLDLAVNYALADTEFKDYLDENYRDLQDTNGFYTGLDWQGVMLVDTVDPDGQVRGNELPQTPRHMASLSATGHWSVADGEVYVRMDYSYESKRYVQAANLAWIGASKNLNMRIGYETEHWDFSVWASNLTNDKTPEVVTRLLDFRQGLLMPTQVRRNDLRFSFIRDFTVSGPQSRQLGATATYRF